MSACRAEVGPEVAAEREAMSSTLPLQVKSTASAEERNIYPREVDTSGVTAEAVAPRWAERAPAAQEIAKPHTYRSDLLRRIGDSSMTSKKLTEDIADVRSRFSEDTRFLVKEKIACEAKRAKAMKRDAREVLFSGVEEPSSP